MEPKPKESIRGKGKSRGCRQKLREAVAALNRHDLEPYLAMMDPDFAVHDPLFPEPIRGKEVIRKINEGVFAALPDIEFEALSMATGGDLVAAEIAMSATFKGPLRLPQGTIPPTGRHLEIRYAAFYRFNSEGLLTDVHQYGLNLREQLGMKA